jgi:hypothetical protein
VTEKHDHKHDHKHHEEHRSSRKPLHHDWRAWVVVVLMLAAMAIYVMSQDESIVPGSGKVQQEVPAAP